LTALRQRRGRDARYAGRPVRQRLTDSIRPVLEAHLISRAIGRSAWLFDAESNARPEVFCLAVGGADVEHSYALNTPELTRTAPTAPSRPERSLSSEVTDSAGPNWQLGVNARLRVCANRPEEGPEVGRIRVMSAERIPAATVLSIGSRQAAASDPPLVPGPIVALAVMAGSAGLLAGPRAPMARS
jgi:hypothetical protein